MSIIIGLLFSFKPEVIYAYNQEVLLIMGSDVFKETKIKIMFTQKLDNLAWKHSQEADKYKLMQVHCFFCLSYKKSSKNCMV